MDRQRSAKKWVSAYEAPFGKSSQAASRGKHDKQAINASTKDLFCPVCTAAGHITLPSGPDCPAAVRA